MRKLLLLKLLKGLILSSFSGLLLAFSWPEIGFPVLIFIAFIPLFILEKFISNLEEKTSSIISIKTVSVFGYSFLTFFIFNILTTYWIWHATFLGAFAAFIINSFLMSFVFVLFHKVKRVLGNKRGYLSLIFLWTSMEYLHLHWDLAWPWLTLGNVFSTIPGIVQWYEFTGVLGGSIWILAINILLFICLELEKITQKIILSLTIIFIPMIISLSLDTNHVEEKTIEVVIVQPNVDPFYDKFNKSYKVQLDDFINLARNKLTQETKFLIGPETALQESLWENKIKHTESYHKLKKLQVDFPNLNILVGATTFRYLGKKQLPSARKIGDSENWYIPYNSVISLGSDSSILIYHKSKLVPGVEQIPYPFIFDLIGDFTVDLGGISGSLGKDNLIHIFTYEDIQIRPLICYESIFGDIITSSNYDLITIITNDGWWKNTAGYKQHFQYARLRAIEQRKSIIRSANTGISGLIFPDGKVINQTNWNEATSINIKASLNSEVTFYNRFGDYLGRVSFFLTILTLLFSLVQHIVNKKTPTL
tara:strand:+ start:376 stop:1980 length:1605 start_codon:yes stop_codon:yes gene_type:complete